MVAGFHQSAQLHTDEESVGEHRDPSGGKRENGDEHILSPRPWAALLRLQLEVSNSVAVSEDSDGSRLSANARSRRYNGTAATVPPSRP